MMVNIFHHGAKENDIFCFKLYVVDFFDIENLHKKFGSNISKIVDFFFYCLTFGSHFSVFNSIEN